MPIIEIDNLTKDYEVGFGRKRKVRALDGFLLLSRARSSAFWERTARARRPRLNF